MPEWFITLGYICLTVSMIGFLAFIIITCFLIAKYSIQAWKDELEFKKATRKWRREG